MAVIDWLRDKGIKGPLIISWSWVCDPDVWLARQIKKVIEKVKK